MIDIFETNFFDYFKFEINETDSIKFNYEQKNKKEIIIDF